MNLTELLDQTASRWPQKPALIERDEIISYAGLVGRVAGFVAQLGSLRLPMAGRVGLRHADGADYIALTFALWRLGAVVVPIPMECTEAEAATLAEAMQLEAVLSQKPQGPGQSEALSADLFFTRLRPALPPDNHGLNLAFIRFTSGTTSARKGVALTHETIRDRVTAANRALGIGPSDTVIWGLPMAHHFLITIILYLSQGATVVLVRHVLAKPFLETVNRWQGTVLYAAPFHYSLLARDASELRLDSVRLAVSTTCALPQAVAEDFHRRFDRLLVPALGIIELGLVSLNRDDPLGRWNSVGRPLADHEVRILTPDESGCGEVAVRGPGFFDAYVAPWLPREQVLRDGWFITGDLGRLDDEGFLFLVARKTAVINLAGRKVFPDEIEAVLDRHPAVRESRVYARTHPHLGEMVEAELVLAQPDTDLESVRDFCRAHLAAYKIPTRFSIVNALPKTPITGKIRRTVAVA